MKKIAILGIDLQNDFVSPDGSLYVKGASEDIKNIIRFIEKHQSEIDFMAFSMDSHQPIHIAHESYWKNERGEFPAPYSVIKSEEVLEGKWIAQYNKDSALPYLQDLEKKGDVCTIWPLHCVLGSKAWALDDDLMNCLIKWTVKNDKSYQLFYKGYSQNTEHYSLFRAAVEYENQPETYLNKGLLNMLNTYDELIIVGEAADFCVANSIKDIIDENKELASKLVVFTDCMSWIIEGNPRAEAIFADAKAANVRFLKSIEYKI